MNDNTPLPKQPSPNSASSPAPYPEDAAERADSVRRRALPIAIAAVICGLAGIAILLSKSVDEAHPPAILAVNLSFCAMMMGIGILFYARGTKGTGAAAAMCALAIAVGFAGPLVYAKQTLDYRKSAEDHELGNVAAIADAARKYAEAHHGAYPADLGVLLEEKLLAPASLHSPYAATPIADRITMTAEDRTRADFLKYIDAHSDYQYFAGDLDFKGPLPEGPPTDHTAEVLSPSALNARQAAFTKIIIASGRDPIMRIHIAVAFADGYSDFVDLEQAEKVLDASNDARKTLGFPEMRPPESVDKALQQKAADPK